MKFSELVSYAKDYPRGERKDLLIIIPAFKEYGNVTRHLKLLAKQDFQAFDVLLILGVPFDDKARLLNIVRSICPDYKITLNSYAEEDFYCEVKA
jgi:hypothetical protein